MNDVDTRKGDIAIGATLILAGVAIVLDRAGVFHWRDHWTLWPLVLGGIGLARLFQSVPGEPKQGLLLLTAAVWLFLTEAGGVSLADSWPILIIVLGLIVAFNGGTHRRRWRMPGQPAGPADPVHVEQAGNKIVVQVERPHRHNRSLSPLAVLGVWIAIFVGLQVSGIRSISEANAGDRVRVVSVMGRSEHASRATAFRGADVTNVMGRSELDLRDATLAPGENSAVYVFSMFGAVVVRVPPTWTVDTGAVSAIGRVGDERDTVLDPDVTAGPAPRLVLRGLIMFGRLTVTS